METRMSGLWNAMAKSQLLPRGGQSLPLLLRAMAIPRPCLCANILFELVCENWRCSEQVCVFALASMALDLFTPRRYGQRAKTKQGILDIRRRSSLGKLGKHPFLVDEQMKRSGA